MRHHTSFASARKAHAERTSLRSVLNLILHIQTKDQRLHAKSVECVEYVSNCQSSHGAHVPADLMAGLNMCSFVLSLEVDNMHVPSEPSVHQLI